MGLGSFWQSTFTFVKKVGSSNSYVDQSTKDRKPDLTQEREKHAQPRMYVESRGLSITHSLSGSKGTYLPISTLHPTPTISVCRQ